MEWPSEEQLKIKYAKLLFSFPLEHPMQLAGQLIEPYCTKPEFVWVEHIAKQWPSDAIVLNAIDQLKTVVPTKDEVANLLWFRLQQATDENAAKLTKELSAVMGWSKIEKKDDGKSDNKLLELAQMIMDVAPESSTEEIVSEEVEG